MNSLKESTGLPNGDKPLGSTLVVTTTWGCSLSLMVALLSAFLMTL